MDEDLPSRCEVCNAVLRGGATIHEKDCPFYPLSYHAQMHDPEVFLLHAGLGDDPQADKAGPLQADAVKTTWTVWMEGFAATGESTPASLIGTIEAESFQDACDRLLPTTNLASSYDPTRLTVWGCRLFPTEREARAMFG